MLLCFLCFFVFMSMFVSWGCVCLCFLSFFVVGLLLCGFVLCVLFVVWWRFVGCVCLVWGVCVVCGVCVACVRVPAGQVNVSRSLETTLLSLRHCGNTWPRRQPSNESACKGVCRTDNPIAQPDRHPTGFIIKSSDAVVKVHQSNLDSNDEWVGEEVGKGSVLVCCKHRTHSPYEPDLNKGSS